jgi:GST-like protein
MIDLYFWATPNAYKVSILLEELGLPYKVIPVHIGKGEQFSPEFMAINPNNKIPAIVDHDGPQGKSYPVFESGAILMYLATKTNSALLPKEIGAHFEVVQWLMFQMGSLGPMLGQAHHFRKYAPETIPYAVERYTNEARRLYKVIDQRLSQVPYLAGEHYSIADISVYPWLRAYKWQGQNIEEWHHLKRWYLAVRGRDAVQRGLAVLADKVDRTGEKPSGERWNNLFGQNQSDQRS